jgi:tetratricopeptide (TPR) repeat protein
MRLNKARPSELYQWWVVTSLALQAHQAAAAAQLAQPPAGDTASNGQQQQPAAAAAGGLSPDKLLQLAEAMAGRLLSKAPAQGGQQHSWEAVMLYLGLLQAQGKHDAALAALRGPLSASFSMAAERREAEAALLLAKGDLEAAAALQEAALREEPDDWAVLLLYLDCLLPGTASTLPACSSTAVAQMVAGVEATTRPGCQAGGLPALLSAMSLGEPERVLHQSG